MSYSRQELAELRHSFRSELNQLIGYTEILLFDADQPPETEADVLLHRILEGGRRLLEVVQKHLSGEEEEEARVREVCDEVMMAEVSQIQKAAAELGDKLPVAAQPDLVQVERALAGMKQLCQNVRRSSIPRQLASYYSQYRPPFESRPRQASDSPGRLLVVDDSEANCELLKRQLEENGYRVDAVPSGEEALARLPNQQYDCILLDLLMPGMNGWTTLAAIRAEEKWSTIPVLMLSALDELSEVSACLDAGADDYLLKPVDRTLLRAKLQSTILRKNLYSDCHKLSVELREANEELKRFVLIASHDLQEPLRTMRSELRDLMKDTSGVGPEGQRRILKLVDRCRRMSSLTGDLLTYSQLGQTEPLLEQVNMDSVLREVLQALKGALDAAGARVEAQPLPVVEADYAQMLRILQNLIGNAIKYRGPEPPYIRISAERREQDWKFAVADNGIGIDPRFHAVVFDIFRRLHGSELPGTGLGLSICKRIVERLGGSIWVESEPGKGSTFYFSLLLKPRPRNG